jgi:hypothetical protein
MSMENGPVACTWEIQETHGLETAWITLDDDGLAARGRAVGLTPEPYWVSYTLETGTQQVTRWLAVTVEPASDADARRLELLRSPDGTWSVNGVVRADLTGALDCDLAFSLLTNTMPILRHRLHQRPGAADLVMAWVSLPDLAVHRSEQRYEHLHRTADGAVVRFAAGSFAADLEVDADGLVMRYPQLGARLERTAERKRRL